VFRYRPPPADTTGRGKKREGERAEKRKIDGADQRRNGNSRIARTLSDDIRLDASKFQRAWFRRRAGKYFFFFFKKKKKKKNTWRKARAKQNPARQRDGRTRPKQEIVVFEGTETI